MQKNSGFTIIELMIVIGIIAILSAIAIPNFINWKSKSNLNGMVMTFKGDVERARVLAIRNKRSAIVELSESNYSIFIDENGNNKFDTGDLKFRDRSLSGVKMPSSTFTANKVNFDSRGRASQSGQLVFENGSGKKTIRVGVLGRVAVN